MPRKELSASAKAVFDSGGVFVPSPLALDENYGHHEKYQRLLTLYYIRSGAKAVIPGAHTGEFALSDSGLLDKWMQWIKEMCTEYGKDMVLMAMVGGDKVVEQAELAVKHGFDAVMIAPTAFSGKPNEKVISLFNSIASSIPVFAFELQRAIPGSHHFTPELWSAIFEAAYGAKGASFDTYRSLTMLEAAAKSNRRNELVLFTGNDDRIVTDLLGTYSYQIGNSTSTVQYQGGLLGHFATDTNAAVNWFKVIQSKKSTGSWEFDLSQEDLAHGVNRCNSVLFDALGNFENSVWGVKYRLASMGLLPGPYCMHEKGRPGQSKAIDMVYGEYPLLNDGKYLEETLEDLKKEVGLNN